VEKDDWMDGARSMKGLDGWEVVEMHMHAVTHYHVGPTLAAQIHLANSYVVAVVDEVVVSVHDVDADADVSDPLVSARMVQSVVHHSGCHSYCPHWDWQMHSMIQHSYYVGQEWACEEGSLMNAVNAGDSHAQGQVDVRAEWRMAPGLAEKQLRVLTMLNGIHRCYSYLIDWTIVVMMLRRQPLLFLLQVRPSTVPLVTCCLRHDEDGNESEDEGEDGNEHEA